MNQTHNMAVGNPNRRFEASSQDSARMAGNGRRASESGGRDGEGDWESSGETGGEELEWQKIADTGQ